MMTLHQWIEADGLSTERLAELLGCNRATAHRLIKLEAFPLGRTVEAIHEASGGRVTHIDVVAYVEAQRQRRSRRSTGKDRKHGS